MGMKLAKLFLAVSFLAAAVPARAGELDLLLDRLVDKNVLDPGEAQEIRVGTQEEVKKEISQQRNSELPMWVQALTFHCDVRVRAQYNDNGNKQYTQYRGRYRLRFWADAKVNDQVYAGFGFASGSSTDPRSTNQTFGDNFGKKGLYIDYVYMEYDPNENVALTAGRTRNPLWTTSELLWDADINPEGVSARTSWPLGRNLQLFGNAGFLVLNELANDPQDPGLLFAQPGAAWRGDNGVWDFKAGAGVYAFDNVKGKAVLAYRPSLADGYQQANAAPGGKYRYGYTVVNPEAEINANILDPLPVPLLNSLAGYTVSYAGAYGSYVKNMQLGANAAGWIAGFKVGQRKVEDAGQWQADFSLRRLEADAWLDTYPDSDFYGGSTNVQGWKAKLSIGLLRDFSLNTAWFTAKPINGALKRERLAQADVNLKF
jgi:hypothetical protein